MHQPTIIITHAPTSLLKNPLNHKQDIFYWGGLKLPLNVDLDPTYNRPGALCGACLRNLSLSLRSSRCLPWNNSWPTILIALLFGSAIIGILLVVLMLVLNLTVASGFISSIVLSGDWL